MDRMGHDSERAAMIYLHGSDARQQAIASTLDKIARAELNRTNKSGTTRSASYGSGTQHASARKHPEPAGETKTYTVYLQKREAPRPRLERGTYCLGGSRSIH